MDSFVTFYFSLSVLSARTFYNDGNTKELNFRFYLLLIILNLDSSI